MQLGKGGETNTNEGEGLYARMGAGAHLDLVYALGLGSVQFTDRKKVFSALSCSFTDLQPAPAASVYSGVQQPGLEEPECGGLLSPDRAGGLFSSTLLGHSLGPPGVTTS